MWLQFPTFHHFQQSENSYHNVYIDLEICQFGVSHGCMHHCQSTSHNLEQFLVMLESHFVLLVYHHLSSGLALSRFCQTYRKTALVYDQSFEHTCHVSLEDFYLCLLSNPLSWSLSCFHLSQICCLSKFPCSKFCWLYLPRRWGWSYWVVQIYSQNSKFDIVNQSSWHLFDRRI